MKFIGLDPSWTGFGVSLINGSEHQSLLISTSSQTPKWERVDQIKDALFPFILGDVFCAIEGYSFGSAFNREMMAELGGIIRYSLYGAGVPYVDITPTSLKKWATGNGLASKADMVKAVRGLGFSVTNHNLADAYALALYAKAYYESENH